MGLYQVSLNYVPGAKNGPALGVTCYTLAYIVKNMKTIFLSETIRPRVFDIWFLASPSGPLQKFVQIMRIGPKMAPPWGLHFYIGLYSKKNEKNFLSETIWPRILIYGM